MQAALCVGCRRDIRTLKIKPSLYGVDIIQVDKIWACGRNENIAIDSNDAFSASFLGLFAIDDTASLCYQRQQRGLPLLGEKLSRILSN